jgi:hypothetical protein
MSKNINEKLEIQLNKLFDKRDILSENKEYIASELKASMDKYPNLSNITDFGFMSENNVYMIKFTSEVLANWFFETFKTKAHRQPELKYDEKDYKQTAGYNPTLFKKMLQVLEVMSEKATIEIATDYPATLKSKSDLLGEIAFVIAPKVEN